MTGARAARISLLLAGTLLVAAGASAQELEELLIKKGLLKGDQYLAGGVVDVHGKVEGDLTMAGGQAGLDGVVSGDVAAIGGIVHVGGVVGDDVRVLGGQVIIQGWVGDGLLAGGGEITLTRGTRVGGEAILGGRRIVDLGDVGGNLIAAGRYVEIAGDVAGRTTIRADEVVIGPKARLSGDLVVRSPNPPRIAEGAQIAGKVVLEDPAVKGAWQRLREAFGAAALQGGLLLVAWAWIAVAPRLSREAVAVEWRRIWLVPGVGVAAVWALLLLVGYASTAICLGEWLGSRASRGAWTPTLRRTLSWTFLSLLLLRAAEALPWVGPAVLVGALVYGAGAVARAAQLAHRRGRVSRGPPGPGAA